MPWIYAYDADAIDTNMHVVHVKDFRTLSNSDADAIELAVKHAVDNDIHVVDFGNETYNITRQINLANGICISGMKFIGHTATIISGINTSLFNVKSSERVLFVGFNFVNNNGRQTTESGMCLFNINGICNDFTLVDIDIKNISPSDVFYALYKYYENASGGTPVETTIINSSIKLNQLNFKNSVLIGNTFDMSRIGACDLVRTRVVGNTFTGATGTFVIGHDVVSVESANIFDGNIRWMAQVSVLQNPDLSQKTTRVRCSNHPIYTFTMTAKFEGGQGPFECVWHCVSNGNDIVMARKTENADRDGVVATTMAFEYLEQGCAYYNEGTYYLLNDKFYCECIDSKKSTARSNMVTLTTQSLN